MYLPLIKTRILLRTFISLYCYLIKQLFYHSVSFLITLFLGREDPLEKKMATHSSILAWETPWTEELSGQVTYPWGRRESGTTEQLHFLSFLSFFPPQSQQPWVESFLHGITLTLLLFLHLFL